MVKSYLSKGAEANYNQFYNNLRLFDILPNFPFTTSETMAIITYKYGIYELPNDLNDLPDLRKLGNIRKLSKLHRMIA